MAYLKNKNFAKSTLAANVAAGSSFLTVLAGTGSKLPSSGNFRAVIWSVNFSNPSDDINREIVTATLSSGDTFDIVRAEEGTVAFSWKTGDKIAHIITAGKIDELEDSIILSVPDYKLRVASDDIEGYLNTKILAGTGISLIENDIAGVKSLTLSLYVAPTASLSGGSVVEIGLTVADVSLTWTCNKPMLTRVLSAPVPSGERDRGAGQNGSYSHIGASLTSNTTYSIVVGDEVGSASSNTSVTFRNRRYYGVDSGTTLTNPQILAFSKEFCAARANTHAYDCTGGRYIWVCYPASFGLATFTVGGLETTFTLTVQNVTNDSGYVESFNLYRSSELQNGSDISVVVT